MVDHEQRSLTISEVAVDWQEPVVLQRKCSHPLSALTDIGPAVAASKHTTAPINHTRPSPHKRLPDVTTSTEIADTRLLVTSYRPRKDERLSVLPNAGLSNALTKTEICTSLKSEFYFWSHLPLNTKSALLNFNSVFVDNLLKNVVTH